MDINKNTPAAIQSTIIEYARNKINEIKNEDYTQIGIIGAQTGLIGYFGDDSDDAALDTSIEDVTELASSFNDFYSESKPIIDSLNLDESSFVFPKNSSNKTRDIHMEALRYATGCMQVADATNNAVIECTNKINETINRDNFVFNSSLKFLTKNYSKTAVQNVFNEIFDKTKADNYLSKFNNSSDIIKDIPYGEARFLHDTLSKINIKTIIVNNAMDKILTDKKNEDVKAIREDYFKCFEKCSNEFNNNASKKKKQVDDRIDGISGTTCIILIIISIVIGIIYNWEAFILLAIVGDFIFTIFLGFLLDVFFLSKYDELIKQVHTIINDNSQMNKIIDTYNACFDTDKIHEAVDKEVISDLYDKCIAVEEKLILFAKNATEIWQCANNAVNEINYLPKGLNKELIPRMIDLLESGSAVDYRSALRQAEQDYKEELARDKQNALLRQAEEKIQNAIRAEQEMEELYEKQRLLEQRESLARQEAAQRRAEEYARKQSEAAQRAEQYSREAADAAAKQTELTEELLRQANDPYYIKLRNQHN